MDQKVSVDCLSSDQHLPPAGLGIERAPSTTCHGQDLFAEALTMVAGLQRLSLDA